MMIYTAEQAVAKGAAWLDEHYPRWVDAIDLATLELSDCEMCMLGQVWNNHIPADERGQIFAQVRHRIVVFQGIEDGYNILTARHLIKGGRQAGELGFYADTCDGDCLDPDEATWDRRGHLICHCYPSYDALLTEWTRVVIQRRLDAHPDVKAEHSTLKKLVAV